MNRLIEDGDGDRNVCGSVNRSVAFGIRVADLEQRPATGESVFDAVPMVDAWLAVLPAEKNHFGAEHAGEIDEPLFDSLAHATMTVDLLDPALNFSDEPGDLFVPAQPLHEVRRLGVDLLVTNEGFTLALEPAQILENVLDQRTYGRQQTVRFFDGK